MWGDGAALVVEAPVLAVTGPGVLGQQFHLSGPQFPHLWPGNNKYPPSGGQENWGSTGVV